MQARPLSNLAARIPSTSSTTSPTALSTTSPTALAATSPPASITTPPDTQPHTCILQTDDPAPLSASPTPTLAETAGLAHDAGNLLGALGLYCDLLGAFGVLRPEHRHYATELSVIFDRSSELIQRLLAGTFATTPISPRPDSSSPARRRDTRSSDATTMSPSHACMLRSLAPVLQRIAAGAAKVSVTCPALLPPLDFPAEIIERITVNLVRNAAEAIRSQQSSTYAEAFPRCGEIRVALTVVASRLQLTVEDNGPGMPPAIAAAFLQPTPLPYGASRGLGHRIIHELATASAGQLSIRVLPGKGTVFSLKWPIPNAELLDPRDLSTLSVKTPPEGSSAC